MKTFLVLIVMIVSLPSWSTVVATNTQDCPEQFEGRIKDIVEPVGSSTAFSMNKVVIENQRNVKGEVEETITLDILANGPFQVEKNKDYLVQLREGKLCWIEEI